MRFLPLSVPRALVPWHSMHSATHTVRPRLAASGSTTWRSSGAPFSVGPPPRPPRPPPAAASACRSRSVRRGDVVEHNRPFLGRDFSAEIDHLIDRLLPFRPGTRSDHRFRRVALATHILKYAGRLLRARERGGSQTNPHNPHRDTISKRNVCASGPYSFRRATTGSTRDARRAGTKQARAATARRISDTTMTVGT